jgi:hypothetical protein
MEVDCSTTADALAAAEHMPRACRMMRLDRHILLALSVLKANVSPPMADKGDHQR